MKRISIAELEAFLADVEANISLDGGGDETDFLKLVVYLFGFAHQYLGQDISIACRVLTVMEMVFTKKLHLLNAQLTADDVRGILPLGLSLVYRWALDFAIFHIGRHPYDTRVVNLLKSFVITIVDLMCTKLRQLTCMKQIRTELVSIVENNLDYLVGSLGEAASEHYRHTLVVTAHLFTILNDHDIASKLLMTLGMQALRFESYARKLWFVLGNIADPSLEHYLKATIVVAMTDNVVLEYAVTGTQIEFVLGLVADEITAQQSQKREPERVRQSEVKGSEEKLMDSLDQARLKKRTLEELDARSFDPLETLIGNQQIELSHLPLALAYALLRIFKVCCDRGILENYANYLGLALLMARAERAPAHVAKALHVVQHYYGVVQCRNTSVDLHQVLLPFEDDGLDAMAREIAAWALHERAAQVEGLLALAVEGDLDRQQREMFAREDERWGESQKQKKQEKLEKRDENSFTSESGDNTSTRAVLDAFCEEWAGFLVSLTRSKPLQTYLAQPHVIYTLVSAAGNFACLASGDFNAAVLECLRCSNSSAKNAYSGIQVNRPSVDDGPMQAVYREVIVNYLLPRAETNTVVLCNFLVTLYKVLASYALPEGVELVDDSVFLFVMRVLRRNDLRDVRILALRLVPLFLIRPRTVQTENNFSTVVRGLESVDCTGRRRHFGESTVRAFTELATICTGEWMRVVFMALMRRMGLSDEQHVNYVYNGFLAVSAAKNITPYKLFSPYLANIAEQLVKLRRLLLRVTDLLRVSPRLLLARTREYTTPVLLENYEHDYVHEIAEASGMSKNELVNRMLPRIMAHYLVQRVPVDERYITMVLSNINRKYNAIALGELISRVGDVTWFVLLKMEVEEATDEALPMIVTNERNIVCALEFVARETIKRKKDINEAGHNEVEQRDDVSISRFLSLYSLELIQKFAENVHHIKGNHLHDERVQSLRAIEYLVTRHTALIATGLGQILSCLQAAMAVPEFEYLTLRCWHGLVQHLPAEELLSLVDVVISLIFQRFRTFREQRSRSVCVAILSKIWRDIAASSTFALYGFTIAHSGIDEFMPVCDVKGMRPMSRARVFGEFTRRIHTRNATVVRQALEDFVKYYTRFQHQIQTEYLRDPAMEPCVGDFVRAVVDAAASFHVEPAGEVLSTASEVLSIGRCALPTACAKVLALMGPLDANRFSFKSVKRQLVVLHDFLDYAENAAWLVDLIETRVLKVFWALSHPTTQLFAAYALQSFLQVLRLNERHAGEVWARFSPMARSALMPLLSSQYFAPSTRYEPLVHPYFRVGMRVEVWLIDVTLSLLREAERKDKRRTKGDGVADTPKALIFSTLSKLIRSDASLCQYLLPYAALSHVAAGSGVALGSEFSSILSVEPDALLADRREQWKGCVHAVFDVLDYLNAWTASATEHLHTHGSSSSLSRRVRHVKAFLDQIPAHVIAVKAAQCGSHERTVLYLERCYRDGSSVELDVTATLQDMYASMDDYDALNGVLTRFATSNVDTKLRGFEYGDLAEETFRVLERVGRLSSARKSECAMSLSLWSSTNMSTSLRLLESMRDRGQYEQVLTTLLAWAGETSVPASWAQVGLEAAIMAGEGDALRKWLYVAESLARPNDVEGAVSREFARGLVCLMAHDAHGFAVCKERIYEVVGRALVPTSASGRRNVLLMAQLSGVWEVDRIMHDRGPMIREVLCSRLENTDQGFARQLSAHSVHQTAYRIAQQEDALSESLLAVSALARTHGRLDLSARTTIQAMMLGAQSANVEYARLRWAQGKQTDAIHSLQEALGDAATQLQYAKWLDESSHVAVHDIINEYNRAIEMALTWEQPYYDLGVYYAKLTDSTGDPTGVYRQQTVRNFSTALSLGRLYIFEALPKLITVWLDYADKPLDGKSMDKSMGLKKGLGLGSDDTRLRQMLDDIAKCTDTIPTYVWYTALTQILSRIVHRHQASYQRLSAVLVRVLERYSTHSLWFVLSHSLSQDQIRCTRIRAVLQRVKLLGQEYVDRITGAEALFSGLVQIAAHRIDKRLRVRRMSLSKDFKVTSLTEPCTSLVIPVRSNLEIRLPHDGAQQRFNAFPKSACVTFDGFDDGVQIFFLLQLPRQVTVRGSDARAYRLMVKKDDTRKDAKVVEFTTMINRLLVASAEARKRSLHIANYAVVPLNENMGVIEFVADVQTMKLIIGDQLKRMGRTVNERKTFMALDALQKEVKSAGRANTAALAQLVAEFNHICAQNRPVLYHWFVHQFADPASWYGARNSFVRLSAVMSIVGYIIGLGDRHCENILFFRKTGLVLHIDFDCLFEKGLLLPTPEIVPFRLTQNMVDAMGICGVEGSFRTTCEVTSTLIRQNEALLMNILETLLYDPLLDFRNVSKPEEHMNRVRNKIRGVMNSDGLAMNVHGQVDVLIQEATSAERLAQMYGGWAPTL